MSECCCGIRKIPDTDCEWCMMGPCAECGSYEPRADHDGRLLCYDHWHKARELTTPYVVRRTTNPEHDGEYGHLLAGGSPPSVLTKTEAEEMAAQFNARCSGHPVWEHWEAYAMPQDFWHRGGRRSHPGYLRLRRAAIAPLTRMSE